MPLKDSNDVIGGKPSECQAPEPPRLRREVVAPQHQPGGLGILLCASAAMFFAVAGSAFVVRAQLRPHCHHHVPTHPAELHAAPLPLTETGSPDRLTVPPTALRVAPAANQAPCGAPSYHSHGDGTVSVSYRLCPEDHGAPATAPDPATGHQIR